MESDHRAPQRALPADTGARLPCAADACRYCHRHWMALTYEAKAALDSPKCITCAYGVQEVGGPTTTSPTVENPHVAADGGARHRRCLLTMLIERGLSGASPARASLEPFDGSSSRLPRLSSCTVCSLTGEKSRGRHRSLAGDCFLCSLPIACRTELGL